MRPPLPLSPVCWRQGPTPTVKVKIMSNYETVKIQKFMTKVKNGQIREGFQGSVDSKVQYSVFQNAALNRETIKEWLKKDVYGTYLLLAEVLASQECLEAITEVFWKRYQEFHKAKQEQPELPLK